MGNGRRVQNVKLETTPMGWGIEGLYIYILFNGNTYGRWQASLTTFSIFQYVCTSKSKQSADNDFRLLFGVPLMTSSRKRFVRLLDAFARPFWWLPFCCR